MLPKAKSGHELNKLLFNDVEAIYKSLYLDKSSSRNSTSSPKSKPKEDDNNLRRKEKKSIWSWKSLKALSLTRNRKFNCSFSLQVHLVEGLPLGFDGSSLCVHWKRRDDHLVTSPAKVIQGVAEFQEILTYTCSIHGSKSGPHNSAKYEAKHILLYASMVGAPEFDLGKHRVDLTRLLPLTLEDLEEEKSSGKWTTSFRLSGAAKGAVMNVSFWYAMVGDSTCATPHDLGSPNVFTPRQNIMALMDSNQPERSVKRTGSLPNFAWQDSVQSVDEVKDLHEVFPSLESKLTSSVDILCENFDEGKTCSPRHNKPELDEFKENIEKLDACFPSDNENEKQEQEEIPDNEGKTCSPVHDKHESDVFEEKVETCSPLHNKPELDEFKENIEKLDACFPSDIENEKQEQEEIPDNEGKTCSPVHDKHESDVFEEKVETVEPDGYSSSDSRNEDFLECEGNGFSVVDQGIVYSSNEHESPEESIIKPVVDAHTFDSSPTLDTAEQDSQDELNDRYEESTMVHEFFDKVDDLCTKELLLQEIESALNNVKELEKVALESPNIIEAKSGCKMRKTHSLDDVKSVAREFFSILDTEHSPMSLNSETESESPRELLLRQFEKDALSEGFSLFDFDMCKDDEEEEDSDYDASLGSEKLNFPEGYSLSSLQDLLEKDLIESKDGTSKQKGQMLEDMETEALMREWGLNEKAFQHSPPKDSAGFRSPIQLLPEQPVTLPPLAEGLGPFLWTKNGGFLRSMNPSLFKNAKSGWSLIMQVSNPVVVPAEMGSGIMEILQCLSSLGIEKLSTQANKLMPLEEITGKTMEQISWEAIPAGLEGIDRQSYLQHDLVAGPYSTCILTGLKGTLSVVRSDNKFSSSSVGNQIGSGLVSLEDVAPLATDKIEALSLEGLRIQSGMSEEDAPSNIITQSFGDISALQDKGVNVGGSIGLDGAAALQLLDLNRIDGIMGLSLRLDEWIKLDSGEIDDIDNISEHTSKLLAAHHANSFDLIRGSSKGEKKRDKGHARKCGFLGNNVTVTLMVQLHDPLRNYEPVGTPMLALVQVERVFVPPKQKIYMRVSEVKNDSDKDDECEMVAKVELKDNKEDKSSEEEGIPQFRVTGIHVAGLKTKPSKKKLWGSSSQQQSGSRWLLANGMGKGYKKNQIMKSKAATKSSTPVTTNVQPGDTLWSISSRIYGTGTKWKELVALNPHIRNPNIIIRNETIRVL